MFSRKTRTPKSRFSPTLESLESRDLMAVTSVSLNAGTLSVIANNANDNVEIRTIGKIDQTIRVKDLTATMNNVWSFAAAGVQRIEVNLNGGNDRLDAKATKPMDVFGGDGHDLILTGGGNDKIEAGAGNDSVFAGSGSDFLYGRDGHDYLDGGLGSDVLHGHAGVNTMFGQEGNDALFAGSRADKLDGGTEYDYLSLFAGQQFAANGEDVRINGVPLDSPQTDGWSCGPNSGSRYLRSYGIDVSYSTLRSQVQENSALSKFKLGTLPSVLRDALKNYKSNVDLDTGASRDHVLQLLGQGKPVIALVAVKKVDIKEDITGIKIGTYGLLHYVVLTGYDQATETVRYTDTTGEAKTWTYAQFSKRSNWVDYFTGAGNAAQEALSALGLKNKTIIS